MSESGRAGEQGMPAAWYMPSMSVPRPAARPLKILVVDDEADVAGLLAEMLTEAGHEVDTAGDGTAALARLGERPFDLVISDVRMPGMDGRALYRALQASHPELGRRLIWITGDILAPGTADYVVASGQPILTKPFRPDAVLAKIAEAWALR
jgi:two-component system NtrC family sensor kinase